MSFYPHSDRTGGSVYTQRNNVGSDFSILDRERFVRNKRPRLDPFTGGIDPSVLNMIPGGIDGLFGINPNEPSVGFATQIGPTYVSIKTNVYPEPCEYSDNTWVKYSPVFVRESTAPVREAGLNDTEGSTAHFFSAPELNAFLYKHCDDITDGPALAKEFSFVGMTDTTIDIRKNRNHAVRLNLQHRGRFFTRAIHSISAEHPYAACNDYLFAVFKVGVVPYKTSGFRFNAMDQLTHRLEELNVRSIPEQYAEVDSEDGKKSRGAWKLPRGYHWYLSFETRKTPYFDPENMSTIVECEGEGTIWTKKIIGVAMPMGRLRMDYNGVTNTAVLVDNAAMNDMPAIEFDIAVSKPQTYRAFTIIAPRVPVAGAMGGAGGSGVGGSVRGGMNTAAATSIGANAGANSAAVPLRVSKSKGRATAVGKADESDDGFAALLDKDI